MKPDSLEQTLGCRGTALFSGKSVRMTPIGLNVMVFWSLSASIDFLAGELFSGCSLHPTHLKSVNKFRMIFKSVWCTYDNAVICFLKKNMNSMLGSSFEIVKLHSTHRKFLISFRAFDSWFCSSSAKLAVILNANSISIQFNGFFLAQQRWNFIQMQSGVYQDSLWIEIFLQSFFCLTFTLFHRNEFKSHFWQSNVWQHLNWMSN